MIEESYSVTDKDSKVAAAEMTSSSVSSPWSAEEQKVELKFCMMLNYQLYFTLASNLRRPYAPFLSQKRTGGIKLLPWYRHGPGRSVSGDIRYTERIQGKSPIVLVPVQELVKRIQAKRQSKQS